MFHGQHSENSSSEAFLILGQLWKVILTI